MSTSGSLFRLRRRMALKINMSRRWTFAQTLKFKFIHNVETKESNLNPLVSSFCKPDLQEKKEDAKEMFGTNGRPKYSNPSPWMGEVSTAMQIDFGSLAKPPTTKLILWRGIIHPTQQIFWIPPHYGSILLLGF